MQASPKTELSASATDRTCSQPQPLLIEASESVLKKNCLYTLVVQICLLVASRPWELFCFRGRLLGYLRLVLSTSLRKAAAVSQDERKGLP